MNVKATDNVHLNAKIGIGARKAVRQPTRRNPATLCVTFSDTALISFDTPTEYAMATYRLALGRLPAGKEFGVKCRTSTAVTQADDSSNLEDDAPSTLASRKTCWAGWILEFAQLECSKLPVLSRLDSDLDSSCAGASPERALLRSQDTELSLDLSEEVNIQKMKQEGDLLERKGKLSEAIAIYQDVLELQRSNGSDEIGGTHLRAGVLQWKRGAYRESLCHLDQAIFAYQLRHETTSDEDFCEVLLATGRVHLSRGDRSLAKKCFRRAISFLQDDRDLVSEFPVLAKPLYAKAMHAMGMVYEASGNLDKGIYHCQVALSFQRQAKNLQTDAAATLLSFGSLYEKKGHYDLALNCFTEARTIYSHLTPEEAPSVDMGVALTSIGWLHYLKGDPQSAMEVYNDALSLFQPLGAHRNGAAVMMHMGMAYVAQGLDCQAAKMYEEALRIQRAVLGDDHEDVATTLLELGSTMERGGRLTEAIDFLDSALRIRHAVFGPKHLHLAETLVQLGDLYVRIGDTVAARGCFTKAKHIGTANRLDGVDARIVRVDSALRSCS